MKKIIFCLQTMTLGGVERELITVLKKIYTQFNITLFLLHLEDKEVLKEIPKDVKINILGIDEDYYYGNTFKLVKQRIKKGKIIEAGTIAFKRCLKIGTTGSNINIDNLPTLEEHFDVAICYHIHSPLMLKYTVQKIKADKKVAWIHNDFYVSKYPIQRLKKLVEVYDEFVAVSKKVECEFRTLCPWYQGKISTAYNYLDANEIIELSNAPNIESAFLQQKQVKILTVSRFSEQKGIDLAIVVCSMLKKENLKFHWFLIGYGELESTYRKLIDEYDVRDYFTILGKKTNPYPYIKNCDIYVQPSRHEAYPLVIIEAKVLHRPIVCTDFDGADEQIDNNVNGIIVPLNDTKALFKEIAKLICTPELRRILSKELEKWCVEDELQEIIKHFE